MKLFVVGATGRTGRLVVEQAVARGHVVTAISRRPAHFESHQCLRTVVGDPLGVDDLAASLPGHDAVVSCLGQRSRASPHLLREAAAAMLEAMSRSGVWRYLVISQGLLFASRNPLIALLRLVLARRVADSTAMERLVRASDLDWTIVRPPRLQEGGVQRGYRIAVGARPDGRAAMQRIDLAAFLVDEAEAVRHSKEIVGVAAA